MRISAIGAEGFTNQISRIREAFENLGHIVTSISPELSYANDFGLHECALQFSNKNCKKILNILDIPAHIWKEPDFQKAENNLKKADAITCISKTVQKDIMTYFGLNAEVIYNPIKPVYHLPGVKKDILALYVGRANDPGKRFGTIRKTFEDFSLDPANLVVLGSENPNFGQYKGVVSDGELNSYYNRAKFVLVPSKFEGLGLPIIEAMVAGAVPIVCNDCEAAMEFAPEFAVSPGNYGAALCVFNDLYEHFRGIAGNKGALYAQQFHQTKIAANIIGVYNKIK